MSKEYTKKCSRCQADIKMSDFSGKWLALELDGSTLHKCSNKTGNGDKLMTTTVQPSTPQKYTNDEEITALKSRVATLEAFAKRVSESWVMNH